MGTTSYKASCARLSFVIFCHPGTLTLRAERHSARMSKIANDSLTRSGTGCFTAVPNSNSGRQRAAKCTNNRFMFTYCFRYRKDSSPKWALMFRLRH